MKYYHLSGGNGYCGCDWDEYVVFYDDVLIEDVIAYAMQLARDIAESYEYIATGWHKDFESEEDREEYYDNAMDHTNWEEITEEEYLINC